MSPADIRSRRAFVCTLLAAGLPARAAIATPFATLPLPQPRTAPLESQALTEKAYRKDAGAHFYSAYPALVYYGKLPPLLYAIAVTETEVDARGAVLNVHIKRAPAGAKHVGPWVANLIRRAAPLPPPVRMGRVRFTEIWLVDHSGRLQVDSLTEGQL
jgi:periplasmic protein TonB